MENSYCKEISGFLSETETYIERIDELSLAAAAELYDLLDEAARFINLHIGTIDPMQRVEVCKRLDMLLERIADELPLFEQSGDLVNIYTPAVQFYRRWENVELMKDCGLVGYMLAKEINATPVMLFGTKPENYPYLNELPLMKMLYDDSEPGRSDTYFDHLKENFNEMDILLLYGMYSHSIDYLDTYRKLRPDGKVYCGLDMNSYWMNTTPWQSAEARRFAGQCDITATSCRSMRDALNLNPQVGFSCRWFTNGFYNPTGIPVITDPDKKENIILTVGRIGTFQKNNEELLTAFANISGILTGWSLNFIGPVEPAFKEYINMYFSKYPHLKDRVIFSGPVTDKEKLYHEYARAKVFALTSRQEGFPNVYAEALFHGCMFVTSDIDAADDITNYGELGSAYPLHDLNALQDSLVEVCKKADKTGMQKHIPKALKYAAKYFDWERNAKKLAYMLFK